MGDFSRKADGRRVFTAEFKQQVVARIQQEETTVAAVSRELGIQPALIRRWINLTERGSIAAVESGEEVVPNEPGSGAGEAGSRSPASGWQAGHDCRNSGSGSRLDIRLLLDKALWSRFGERTLKTPIEIQWLSDNGGPYTCLETVSYAAELGFKPSTTPAYSPASNGMAEVFVNTMRRDYVGGADLSDAETVLRQLPGWIEDYNRVAPHSAFGNRSPWEYRET